MVRHPRDDGWSTFCARTLGRINRLAGERVIYRALGRVAEARQRAYRARFRGALESGLVAAAGGGWTPRPSWALRTSPGQSRRRRAEMRCRVRPAVRGSNRASTGDSSRCFERLRGVRTRRTTRRRHARHSGYGTTCCRLDAGSFIDPLQACPTMRGQGRRSQPGEKLRLLSREFFR
jgi:hypothetical protein